MIRNRYMVAVNDKPWWLAGGIAYNFCYSAYKPKGASSLDASYVNLANPDTYKLASVSAPSFNATTGWTFNSSIISVASPGWYMRSFTVIADLTPSAPGTDRRIIGGSNAIDWVLDTNNKSLLRYSTDNYTNVSTTAITGRNIVAISYSSTGNLVFYLNGIVDGTATEDKNIAALSNTNAIGANSASAGPYYAGEMASFAIYNTVLTNYQVAMLTNAMLAL